MKDRRTHPPDRPKAAETRTGAQSSAGWEQYLAVLESHRVPSGQRDWYVRRARAFVDAVRPTRMREVSGEQITAFFHSYGREQHLTGWQFRQTVDAVQLLLVELASFQAAHQVDWDYWKEAGEGLAPAHPTLVGELTPEEAVLAEPRLARSTEQHPLLKTLAHTLRTKRYAIRTEQTYVDWCHRFLFFVGRSDPDHCSRRTWSAFSRTWSPSVTSLLARRTRR